MLGRYNLYLTLKGLSCNPILIIKKTVYDTFSGLSSEACFLISDEDELRLSISALLEMRDKINKNG